MGQHGTLSRQKAAEAGDVRAQFQLAQRWRQGDIGQAAEDATSGDTSGIQWHFKHAILRDDVQICKYAQALL